MMENSDNGTEMAIPTPLLTGCSAGYDKVGINGAIHANPSPFS
jgi:hypothetical protein